MRPSKNFILALILAITFLSFCNTLSFDFTNWDDDKYLMLNPRIRDLSASGIVAIFSGMDMNLYTPLTTLSFALDYRFWELSPAGYHAVNLLLHLLNVCLVFQLCLRLSSGVAAAGITACLFGVHPIHVESVAWIAERKDLLFSMFALMSLVLYDCYREDPKKRMIRVMSILMFLCSLLAKPQAVALPVVMLLMDKFRDARFDFRRSLNRIWPFALVTVLFCGATLCFSVIAHEGKVHSFSYTWWNRPFLALYAICFYIVKLIWPFRLTAFYECPPEIHGMLPPVYYLSALGAGGLVWTAWRLWKRGDNLAFGIFFFLLMLLPVIQIVPFGQVIVADRYAYLASIGIFLIIGQVLADKIKAQPALRYLWKTVLVLVMLALAWLTHERAKVWENSVVLFSDVIAKNPRIAPAYNNRGMARYQNGDYAGAAQDYNQAICLDPKYAYAFNNRGLIRFLQGDYAGADRDYNEAIRLDPKYASAFCNRGTLRLRKSDAAGALRDYATALTLDPYHAETYYNRGLLFEGQGDADRALRDYADAILANPQLEWAFIARGTLRAERGQYDRALVDFKNALRLNRTNAVVYFNMSKVYLAVSNPAAARLCFEEARKFGLRPESLPVTNNFRH